MNKIHKIYIVKFTNWVTNFEKMSKSSEIAILISKNAVTKDTWRLFNALHPWKARTCKPGGLCCLPKHEKGYVEKWRQMENVDTVSKQERLSDKTLKWLLFLGLQKATRKTRGQISHAKKDSDKITICPFSVLIGAAVCCLPSIPVNFAVPSIPNSLCISHTPKIYFCRRSNYWPLFSLASFFIVALIGAD